MMRPDSRPLTRIAGAMLGVAGVLMIASEAQRWADCPWGSMTSAACVAAQDHRYDVLLPSAPWVPIGHAAELAGLALIVLALAAMLLSWQVETRRAAVGLSLYWAATAGLAGVVTLASGLAGRPTFTYSDVLALGWSLSTWVVLLVTAALIGEPTRGTFAMLGALGLVNPLLIGLLPITGVLMNGAYDSYVWQYVLPATVLCLAGAIGVFDGRRPRRSRASGGVETTRPRASW